MYVIKKEDGSFEKIMFESRDQAKCYLDKGYVSGVIMRVDKMQFTVDTLKYLDETGCIERVY